MNKVDGVKQAEGLRDILLPMIWFSDDIDHITDQEVIDKIKQRLQKGRYLKEKNKL